MLSLGPLISAAVLAAPACWAPGEGLLIGEPGIRGKLRVPDRVEGVASDPSWLQAFGHLLMKELKLGRSVLQVMGQGHAAAVLEQELASRSRRPQSQPVPLLQGFLQSQLLISVGRPRDLLCALLSLSLLPLPPPTLPPQLPCCPTRNSFSLPCSSLLPPPGIPGPEEEAPWG